MSFAFFVGFVSGRRDARNHDHFGNDFAGKGLTAMVLGAILALGTALGEDWPTYQHDHRRSGVTTEALKLPLTQAWVCSSGTP
ncbi:MAG: hypothetical protein FJ278_21885, partial [Planctomycetes bacterium]|nr:hypothetical protein [Planctomycetota bacterium]